MTPDRFIAAAFREWADRKKGAGLPEDDIIYSIEQKAAELARESVGDGELPKKAIVEVAEEAYREAITGMGLALPEWSSLAPMRHALRTVATPPSPDSRSVGGDVERDAARYRWLRANNIIRVLPVSSGMMSRGGTRILANTKDWLPGDFTYVIDGVTKDVDAAIDAALAGVSEGKE